jgi:nucleoside-diphosphate-sugar epimerase
MKALVTGSNGFIGSHLVKFLLENNNEVIGLDTGSNTSTFFQSIVNENIQNFRYVSSDIRINNEVLEDTVKNSDVIFHLAASVGIPNYINLPVELFEVNVVGSYNLINLCLKHDKKIIFSSTSEIYGKNPEVPWGENADRILGNTEITRWNYATSKATIEHLLNSLNGKLQYKIIRYFNVYGPGQKPIFLISKAIHNGLNSKELQIYDSGVQTRCFTYIDDAIKATYLISNLDSKHNTFNIGNDLEVSIKAVMSEISSYFPSSAVIDINTEVIYGIYYEDLNRRIPDVSRIYSETNWKSTVQIEQGIKLFVDWAKKNEFWWSY